MSDAKDIERTLGSLDARMTALESYVRTQDVRIDARLSRIENTLEEVKSIVVSRGGAWRAIAWLAGMAGAVAGAVGAFAHWLMPHA